MWHFSTDPGWVLKCIYLSDTRICLTFKNLSVDVDLVAVVVVVIDVVDVLLLLLLFFVVVVVVTAVVDVVVAVVVAESEGSQIKRSANLPYIYL